VIDRQEAERAVEVETSGCLAGIRRRFSASGLAFQERRLQNFCCPSVVTV
jgi:hypothetical protein